MRLKPKIPLEKDEAAKVGMIVTHLLNHSDSGEFQEPVDWKGRVFHDGRAGLARLFGGYQEANGFGHCFQENQKQGVQDSGERAE